MKKAIQDSIRESLIGDDLRFEGGDAADKDTKEKKEKYYKEDLDKFKANEEMKDGYIKDRKCTDIIPLILFFIFVAAMGALTVYGYKNGDVKKLLAPTDGQKRFCGQATDELDKVKYDLTAYPYLFLPDFTPEKRTKGVAAYMSMKQIFAGGVCVKACPGKQGNAVECPEGTTCPTTVYPTKTFIRYCLPRNAGTQMKDAYADFMHSLKGGTIGSYFNDMYMASTSIKISIGMSFVYSLLFIALMSLMAEIICWACIVILQVGLLGLPVLFWLKRMDAQSNAADTTNPQLKVAHESRATTYLWATIGTGILACCFATCLCCTCSYIKTALNVVDAAADFIMLTKRILFVPLIYFIITILAVAIWLGAYLCVISLNHIGPSSLIDQGKDLTWSGNTRLMALFMFFGIIWICVTIDYCKNMVVLASSCTYYFNSTPEADGSADVSLGFRFASWYHLGSLTMGALIIAIIKIIRFLFVYLARKAQNLANQQDNCVINCLIGCGDCCLKCIEKICDYINNCAFAYQAVSGESFCISAWNGFLLNAKHIGVFGTANWLAAMLIVVGKLAVTIGNCFSCILIMRITGDQDKVTSNTGPVILVGLISWIAAQIFLGLFDTAILGIMTSYAIDIDTNGLDENGNTKHGPATFHENRTKAKELKAGHIEEEKKANNTVQDGPAANTISEGGSSEYYMRV